MWIRQKYGQRRNVNVEAAAAAAATHHHNTNQVLFHVRSTFGSRRHIRHQIVVPALRKETKKNQRKENYLLRVQVKSRKMRRPEKEETHDCFLTSHLLMQCNGLLPATIRPIAPYNNFFYSLISSSSVLCSLMVCHPVAYTAALANIHYRSGPLVLFSLCVT